LPIWRAGVVEKRVRRVEEPAPQKSTRPASHCSIVLEPAFDMPVARASTGLSQALAREERPTAHSGKCHFRVKLEAIGLVATAEGLRLEVLSPCQQSGTVRKLEALPVPLIDVARELALAKPVPMVCWMNGIITDLDAPLRMRADPVAKMAREHLCTKANANEGNALLERDTYPAYLAAQPSVLVIDAHWAAENDDTGIIPERFGQRIVETRTPAVEFESLRAQELPNSPGSGMSLMQDNENPAAETGAAWHT
jgi:hypothetical protein